MKKIKLGILGPLDAVELVQEVAADYDHLFKIVPIIYQDPSETVELVKNHIRKVDILLFTSSVIRGYAEKANLTTKPMLYIPLTSTSLYRSLLQILCIDKLPVDTMSIDTFHHEDVTEAFADIPLPLPQVYVNDQVHAMSVQEITDFHQYLWQNGQTKLAITYYLSVYKNLRAKGIPAFRARPTRDNVRVMLNAAVKASEALQFKDRQIAIQHIAIDGYADFLRTTASSYAVKRVELELYRILVDYAELCKGSIVIHDHGQYTIYSTRGVLEEITHDFTTLPIIDTIRQNVAVNVSGGIGFGHTANHADENAHIAIDIARQQGKGQWMILTDDRTVIGPLQSNVHMKYSLRASDSFCQQLAQKLSISMTTVNRLLAALDQLDKETIQADELAACLAITPRSARRLLGAMTTNGLATIVGSELIGKGRPRNLYRISVAQLISDT